MSEQPLQRQNIPAVPKELHRETVAQQMGVEPFDATAAAKPAEDVPDVAGGHRHARGIGEDPVLIAPDPTVANLEIAAQGTERQSAGDNDSLLLSFSGDRDLSRIETDIGEMHTY